MSDKGRFIVFEGPDGVGKTSVIQRVAEEISRDGYEVVVTREPGGTPFAEDVRALLLKAPDNGMHPETRNPDADMLLVYASRAQHLYQVIIPALQRGAVVLCDRFSASTFAYQVGAGRADEQRFWVLDEHFVYRQPDTYFYLDAPLSERKKRLGIRNGGADRFDDVADQLEELLLPAYDRFLEQAPQRHAYRHTRFLQVDASEGLESVADLCFRLIVTL